MGVSLTATRRPSNAYSPLLREIVNYSTHTFVACLDEMRGRLALEEAVAVMRLHLHIIETSDAVEVLLRQGCGQAALALGRGVFEASLHLAAIHAHKDFREASLAWLVGSTRREIANLKTLKATLVGKRHDLDALRKLGAAIQEQEQKLAFPALASLAKRIDDEKWYRAIYRAKNLRELCQELDRHEEKKASSIARFSWRHGFGSFYGRWSSALHASDWRRVATAGDGGEWVVSEIRRQHTLAEVIPLVAGFALEANVLQLRRFRPDQESTFRDWYVQHVRGPFIRLSSVPVGDTNDW